MSKYRRRRFLRNTACGIMGLMGASALPTRSIRAGASHSHPNILFAMADDWSWPHAGAYGDTVIKTPVFDHVAREGVLFTQAFAAAPQCSPNRAAILTGRNIWQLEEAGTHNSIFPNKFIVYPDLLEKAGYHIGCTGKLWGPGNWRQGGWTRNPAGPEYNQRTLQSVPTEGIMKLDYAGNFKEFLDKKPKDKPFYFWYGGKEPHRKYEKGSGLRAGMKIEDVKVPDFLPDTPEVRSDILDYYLEVEWFDSQLAKMLHLLEESGEFDNTLIVVTSDNGMPFPHAKANLYEYGTHMPLAICWSKRIPHGRVIDDLISFIDFAPTFVEAAGVKPPASMTGKSFLNILTSKRSGRVDPSRKEVFTGRERHSHSRPDNLGYPSRSIRTDQYLYIRNFKPVRWPAGDPDGYYDIDAGPTKTFMREHHNSKHDEHLFQLAFGKRPAEELYDIRKDPSCIHNLANLPGYATVKSHLKVDLDRTLRAQKDPRVLRTGDIFESYPRFGRMRDSLPGFHEYGKYNPKYQQQQQKKK